MCPRKGKEHTMPIVTALDGARIYKDWGYEDPIIPIAAALMPKIVSSALLKFYEGGGHGLPTTHHDAFNADFLGLVCGEPVQGTAEQGSNFHG
jgi:hypothetical protein